MGIAAPSVAEASSRLPSSVKAGQASADDVLVTSVASFPPAVDEPVSPELVLVDPELRERLRALLPEIELELSPPVLRALPDPEPEDNLALTPPPELVEEPALVPVPAPVAALPARPAPVYLYPTRGERVRSFAKAFALGAAAATVITVGVVAERGEGPVAQQDPGTAPPSVASPVPVPKVTSGAGATQKTAKKPPSSSRAGTRAKQAKTQAASHAKTERAAAKGAAKPKTAANTGRSKATPPPAAATAEPKRFAWAPVDGAVGYRFELFRGTKQVLEVRTKAPAYELASRWRHAGRTEILTSGEYRWYVWPLLASGPADAAVVQARLTIP